MPAGRVVVEVGAVDVVVDEVVEIVVDVLVVVAAADEPVDVVVLELPDDAVPVRMAPQTMETGLPAPEA